MSSRAPLLRRVAVEGLGTGALVAVVVGSGIQATGLTQDVGVRLLANSLATVFGLAVLIALLGPVSGAHFNPVVTLAVRFADRRTDGGFTARDAALYVPAQIAGAIGGAVLADAMFGRPLVRFSAQDRFAGHLWLGEIVATAGLIWLVLGLARAGRAERAPLLVASYIGAAYWFTSSTSFANPAVTIGRAFTDTFAGIAPSSVAPFLGAQLIGAALGVGLVAITFGRAAPADENEGAGKGKGTGAGAGAGAGGDRQPAALGSTDSTGATVTTRPTDSTDSTEPAYPADPAEPTEESALVP
ncbi:aquaporin [Streptomyces sp. NBC_01498]|uniref:aquaporin n=1 Tax=Streptomyces sp. NBC_01498 TaxID=2975870 RepID=UPI003FCE2FB2